MEVGKYHCINNMYAIKKLTVKALNMGVKKVSDNRGKIGNKNAKDRERKDNTQETGRTSWINVDRKLASMQGDKCGSE